MRLSDFTLDVLENFININEGIVIKKDNLEGKKTQIRSSSPDGTSIMAKVVVPEIFDNDVCISDLRQFSNVVKAIEDPEFSFEESQVLIQGDNVKTSITYARDTEVAHDYSGYPEISDKNISFTLNEKDLLKILKLSDILQLKNIKIDSENGNIVISGVDRDNPDVKTAHVIVDTVDSVESAAAVLPLYFPRSIFKLIPATYKVTACNYDGVGGLAFFTTEDNVLEYVIPSMT